MSAVKVMVRWFVLVCVVFLFAGCKSAPKVVVPEVVEPEMVIQEPVFTITSIEIKQASLINTLFECTMKIDNPNIFPVNVASLRYDLYGNGRLWGGGRERDLTVVPAQSSKQTEFSFEMNFIDMPRSLLDDIIALKQVRYRFTGEAEIGADRPNLPVYHMAFDLSGDSDVKK
jgi:LEA14-like dessication related protein